MLKKTKQNCRRKPADSKDLTRPKKLRTTVLDKRERHRQRKRHTER